MRRLFASDAGNAVVEVAFLAPVLLVPLVWVSIAVAVATDAQSTAVSAARQAARAYVMAPDVATATAQAHRIGLAVLATDAAGLTHPSVRISCAAGPCLSPNSRVDVTVSAVVPLSFVPIPFGRGLSQTVTSTQSALVDPFR